MLPESRTGPVPPPFWSEWEWDDDRQLLRRNLTDYRGHILREQFGKRPLVPRVGVLGLEPVRDYGQTTAGVPPPNYGSAVGLEQPQPWTEPERPNQYIERLGLYQLATLQLSPLQSYPPSEQLAYEPSRSKSPTYDPATTFQPGSYVSSTQRPQASFISENSSYRPSLGPQQRQNLANMYASSSLGPSTSLQDSPYEAPIPSAQYQRFDNPVERSPLSFGRSAHDEEFSGVQDGAGYMTIRNPGGYFKPGRIFKARTNLVESKKRSEAEQTFVVLQEGPGAAVCAPLQTYDATNVGYAFRGENSALVFTAGDQPQLLPWEDPSRMAHFPVFIEDPSERIDPKSRINLANTLMIEHSAKVRNVGRVDRNSVKELRSTLQKVTGVQPDPHAQQTEWENNNNADENDFKSSGTFLGDRSKSNDIEYSVDQPSVQSDHADLDDEQLELGYADSSYTNVLHHSMTHSRHIVGSSRTAETHQVTSKASRSSAPLHPEYKVNKSKNFRRGSVLKLLWSEPLGNTKLGDSDSTISKLLPGHYGEKVYQSVRRFVIVKEREGHSICVPILTYGLRGTKKLGVKSQDHAIIYTGQEAPEPLPGEDLQWNPIKLEPATDRDKLAPQSRINYAKVYTVEHNVKVHFIGKIHADSERQFFEDFKVIDSREDISI